MPSKPGDKRESKHAMAVVNFSFVFLFVFESAKHVFRCVRISLREYIRPSIRSSVCPSVRPFVGYKRVEIMFSLNHEEHRNGKTCTFENAEKKPKFSVHIDMFSFNS